MVIIIGVGQNNVATDSCEVGKNILVFDFALKSDIEELLKIKENQQAYDTLLIKNMDVGLNYKKFSSRESCNLLKWFSCYKFFGFETIICLASKVKFVDKLFRDYASIKFDLKEID